MISNETRISPWFIPEVWQFLNSLGLGEILYAGQPPSALQGPRRGFDEYLALAIAGETGDV